MKLAIIIIGDEILLGRVTDTNSGAIARALDPLGFSTVSIDTVGDNRDDISRAVNRAMSIADLVITTGGLGPTKDDITKHVLTDIFGGSIYRDPEVTANIHNLFDRRGIQVNPLTEDQALVPDSCRVIQNRLGTAPIMWFEKDGRVLISMPGVPFETEGMLKLSVIDNIAAHFHSNLHLSHTTFITAGITESALAERLASWEDSLPEGFHLAYLPDSPIIKLRLDGAHSDVSTLRAMTSQLADSLRELLGPLIIYQGDASLGQIVIERLRSHGMTLATAESCTGGNIAHTITEVAGCSDVYVGGVVSYANHVKADTLGVDLSIIDNKGAVSEEVVAMMARGVCRLTGAHCAVATSGIAGPGGAVDGKPVGTVWIATCTPKQTSAHLYHFPGDRSRVISRATSTALLDLLKAIDTL